MAAAVVSVAVVAVLLSGVFGRGKGRRWRVDVGVRCVNAVGGKWIPGVLYRPREMKSDMAFTFHGSLVCISISPYTDTRVIGFALNLGRLF